MCRALPQISTVRARLSPTAADWQLCYQICLCDVAVMCFTDYVRANPTRRNPS